MQRILVSLTIVTLGLLVSAPSASAIDAHFGVKGGLNIANLNFEEDDLELQDSRMGAGFGAYAQFPVNDFIAVQPEALFMMKGDEEDISGTYDLDGTIVQLDGTVSVKASYLEIPVLGRFSFAPEATVRPALLVGPAVAFNLSADLAVEGEADGTSVDISEDISEDVKSIDVGLVVGAGLEFPVGSGGQNIGLDVRYNVGLINVDDTGADDVKNLVLSVAGTFGFN